MQWAPLAVAVPAKKDLGGDKFLLKFCDICLNYDFLILYGNDKNCLRF